MTLMLVSTAVGMGGAERYLAELALWLKAEDLDPQLVIAAEIADAMQDGLHGSGIAIAAASIGWTYGPEDNSGGPAYGDKVERQRVGMATALAHLPRADMVLFNANWPTHYIGAMQATAASATPFAVHFHLCPHRICLNPAAAAAHAAVLPKAAFLSCVSRNNRFFLERTFGRTRDFQVVSNGSRFDVTPEERADLASRSRVNKFLVIGRLDHQKGVLDILPALSCPAPLRGAEIEFVGDGPLKQVLDTALVGRPVTARTVGAVTDIRERLSMAEAMILPSHFEGLALSILEAMSLGCVPIVSRASSATEVVEDGVNGFLFDVADWRSMLRAVERFQTCNRTAVRTAALDRSQMFTRSGMMRQMQSLLREHMLIGPGSVF